MERDPRFDGAALAPAPTLHTVPATPEIRLLAAILEDACFCLHPGALVSRDTRADAVAWVRGEVRSAAYCSFREVCDILGLDVQAVRDTLLTRAGATLEFTAPSRARHALVSSVRHT